MGHQAEIPVTVVGVQFGRNLTSRIPSGDEHVLVEVLIDIGKPDGYRLGDARNGRGYRLGAEKCLSVVGIQIRYQCAVGRLAQVKHILIVSVIFLDQVRNAEFSGFESHQGISLDFGEIAFTVVEEEFGKI
ncbi:MAG: hypothetical protein KDC32_25955, partial [Saprospiraceae bacterium]|nr:hypothetical protein [Saprospiraceae bacterium]